MDPLPSGAGSLKWAKYIVRGAAEAFTIFESFLTYGSDVDADTIAWKRLHVVGTRAQPTGSTDDKVVMTFDICNITGGAVDTSWITSDYTTAEAKFNTFLTALLPAVTPKLTWTEYRWYNRGFAPAGSHYVSGAPQYFTDAGAPDRVTSISLTGTASGSNQPPEQVAISVTERTPIPKHWGRFYIPKPATSNFDAYGRIQNATFFADKAATLYDDLSDADLYPVVPVGAHQSLLGVSEIQVDDVPDVIRSRRARTTLDRQRRVTG